ncbi:pogo transposable element with KRAB domain [Rhizophagus irregularis DAOM 181602=DAOM 197198]|nr:pogo transposable element with KRAB domain [Rhizophagus irregularis DAOM 181602=DAOM 197198]
MRVGSGRKAFYPEAEKELYDWILDQRKKRLAVTFVTIRISINEILDRADMVALYGDLITEFKATTGWLNAFMKRHNLIRYQRTKISQKLPKQLEEKLEEFYRFVIHLGIQKSFELCNILNMDKIPVWFDMARNFTINTKREKTVHICGIDNENNQFTVVLTCAADGTRLPPICIFKGKQMPRGEKAPPSVVVWVQENRWMKIELMKCYINYLNCMRSSNSQSRFPAMMDNLRKEWHFWMSNGGAGYTEAGNLQRAKISDVCRWSIKDIFYIDLILITACMI